MPSSHLPVPSEDQEQAWLIQWLDLQGYKYTAIPNHTYTTSWKQKAHNKALGLRAGFPDLVVIVNGQFIAIEMKRTKGSTTSKEQKDWIEALNNAGVPAKVCKGAQSAIEFIEMWAHNRKIDETTF